MKKIVLGLSGGVDSAVSALLLLRQHYDVYGLYLDTTDEAAKEYAQLSAKSLGIPLEIYSVNQLLEENVCRPFADAYSEGCTPIPCILCNPAVKFRLLCIYADSIGAQNIATGHYALAKNGKIYQGNPSNDQSYMLCRLTPEQAARAVFPLGEISKSNVRDIAQKAGIPSASKPDSQEICFIPDKDYRSWLEHRGIKAVSGNFLLHGKYWGRHEGITHYTVGQRLPGFFEGRKLYVSAINAADNTISLCWWDELFFRELTASSFNWLDKPCEFPFRASVRVRHTRWETPECTVYPDVGNTVRIVCDTPVRAPAPGQSAVLYRGTQLLGGGFIEKEKQKP